MPGLIDDFKDYIQKEKLFLTGDLLLLAVSGGVDSVVLCELCSSLEYPFVIAHCNFQLRGEESDGDELFVRSLGNKYNAAVLVKQFETSTYATQKKVSIQVAARELRYEWFNTLIGGTSSKPVDANKPALHPAYILTAHHADDNIETVLMNFFKGTGIAGMRGILPKTGKIIRPLLFANKNELSIFAKERGLSYREDSSNYSDKYSRNYVRHQVIPLLEKIYPEASQNLVANINRFRDTEMLYNEAIAIHKKKLVEYRNNEMHIPVLKLQKTAPLKTIIYEIIKEYGFTGKQADEVTTLLHSERGKFLLSATHRILKNRNWLIISPLQTTQAGIIVIEKDMEEVAFGNGQLVFTRNTRPENEPGITVSPSAAIGNFDMKRIHFPLLLRKWKTGDYFYPLGMTKKKKLSRFFIDRKLSLGDKEKVWVLEMNKKIIWVINQRIDERFKINDNTKEILKINFLPA